MGPSPSKPTTDDTNLETFSLLWLDSDVNTSAENIEAQDKLRTIINHLKTFDNDKQCEEYIQDLSENDRIVLISSGRLGREFVPRVHHLRQIFSIYIYCKDKERHKEWSNGFIKVQGVFVVLGELINRIRSDRERRKHNKADEQLSISIFNTEHLDRQWKTESKNHFIYSQVLIDCLLQMPITPNEKNELITLCKTEYRGNKAELQIINEFQKDYKSDQAIWWYTRDSFLYKMLNKALRIQNIDLLLLFRYVIHDIQYQLEKNKFLSSICVYRGQLMSKDELQMLKDSFKAFISINSFISAIHDRKSALWFLFDLKVSSDIERVLFEIHADEDLNDVKAFNIIKSESYYNQEEIFFSIGSIFQLIDIHLGEENIWIIQMKLCTNNHKQLQPIFEHIESEYGNAKTSLLSFGLVAQKMNKFDEAEKYYRRLIKLLPAQHKDASKCQDAITTITIKKEIYKKKIESMGKSVYNYMEISKTNDRGVAFTHSLGGETYRSNGDLARALESYEKAISIWKTFSDGDQEQGRCYYNMGLIYQEKNEYEKALEYYEKAQIILKRYLLPDHKDLCAICVKIEELEKLLEIS